MKDNMYKELGLIIKSKRVRLGITQGHLAETVGLTEQAIYYYERGARKMSVDTYFQICKALNLDPVETMKEVESLL